jgi:hypothetical protein
VGCALVRQSGPLLPSVFVSVHSFAFHCTTFGMVGEGVLGLDKCGAEDCQRRENGDQQIRTHSFWHVV